jgi:hypothetical protein
MKKLSTLKDIMMRCWLACLLFISLQGYSQPDYSFAGATLTGGTNLQAGASYRFPTVRPGIDALMTITAMSPGIGLTELDGSSGYPATIQPTITAAPWTNGYVEMTITFVTAGTSTGLNQPQIAVTCIDVDGVTNYDGAGHNLHEFDQINMGGGYADFNTMGGELSISQSGNWFTGTNISGTDYPGRDTSSQQVMFSVINSNVTSMVIRVGVNNQTANAASRLRSVYFKKFVYNNSILALHDVKRLKPSKSNKNNDASVFSIYPTVIQRNATINVQSAKDGWASFELFDYSGRAMVTQQLIINKGENKIPFFGTSSLANGNYVALLKIDGMVYNYKVIKQ